MAAYWALFCIPAFLALSRSQALRPTPGIWYGFAVVIALFIGTRYFVGGDWVTYEFIFRTISHANFGQLSEIGSDPGYTMTNWVVGKLGGNIVVVNVICAVLFTIGLWRFCRSQPYPWLAVIVAIPYAVIVVAMGYTRQGVALGLILWALACLGEGRFYRYLLLIALAATFHRTAVLLIPLGIFVDGRGRAFRFLSVALAAWGLWDAMLAEDSEHLWRTYVSDVGFVSEGAYVRTLMNFVPAMIMLIYWKSFRNTMALPGVWRVMSVAAVICMLLVPFATTAVDRVSLYLIPLQIVVFSHFPLVSGLQRNKTMIGVIVVAGYALVQFVWLNFAQHAYAWLPYRSILLGG
ncbi:EpsG family protein [Marinihelvus fidelis]|uniref:EpsG family protein n=1 Tax=Marinihelvus fidelis TaxID=2613842 RepID=A0A5N0TGR1_9GAMM|nr:EpsG family protein [Marinihelvus fidelis]KAA9133056.1 EpsG family protein [Marinihelvus fidelis]